MQQASQNPTSRIPPRRPMLGYPQRRRMTPAQKRAWDRAWSGAGKDVADLPAGPLDIAGWFGRTAPIVLEVGSGMGESTASMALDTPAVDHLAVEVYEPGLAQLLRRVSPIASSVGGGPIADPVGVSPIADSVGGKQAGITNLRLLRGDAQTLLAEHIAAHRLHGVRIYFPDPWPKRRHHKRRLVNPEFVALVTSRLVVGGTLHLATDWEPYAAEMLTACAAEPGLRNTAPDNRFAVRPLWRPVTKFEQRARDEGRAVRDLLFARV